MKWVLASLPAFSIEHGVREMLVKLQNYYPLSMISAHGQKSTFRFLLQFDLLFHFTAVATGQTSVHTKPYPDPSGWAAERIHVHPDACLMVGDSVVDIISNKKAGAQTVGVLSGFGERKELERGGAEIILENTAELLNIFITK